MRQITPVLLLMLLMAVLPARAAAPALELREDVREFVREMAQRHGFRAAALEQTLREARVIESIIRAMDAPSTALPWHAFRARHVTGARLRGGLQFWAEHAEWLDKASARHGVPSEIIVATIGVETQFGRRTGNVRVLDALNTLAFHYPRRAAFFRGELEQFLLLARENGLVLNQVRGSFAGAIGIPQFLPSSYRKYAVDFDGDGVRDLRQMADAIGSVANYYRSFGWREGEAVMIPVDVAESALDPLLAGGIQPHMTVAGFRSRGVVPLEPVAEDALAALFSAETDAGIRYWLGLTNFHVITRYNRSINYALLIHELSTALRQARGTADSRP